MASLSAIRDAIKTTVAAAVTSLHGYDTFPESPNLPAFIVVPATTDFLVAMGRGVDTYEFNVVVLAPYADADIGQDAVDGFVTGAGSNSIRQAIWNNRALGLSDVDAHVAGMNSYGATYEGVGIEHVGASLRVVVHTIGTA